MWGEKSTRQGPIVRVDVEGRKGQSNNAEPASRTVSCDGGTVMEKDRIN